ncbi:response regulator [Phreatobacter aquaticus]|uniref:Regulatory protein VirG n=1 Tax=Phreatobacter aquaticus TaxID=2570229 RepID=A0A4D7QHB1_9HYPH|nr:response regulator [Phreatobacter aquaticus]QCK86101.1 response regulator [Phreatobacter aquaticus]
MNAHVVVVDDEAAARDMVGDYLKLHGFEVSLCDSGAALRSLMTSRRPDIVVLDLNMPEEDGFSVVRHVKRTAGTPIIMLTATASPVDRIVGLEIGADDYLAKPCELRELLARIRAVLRRAAAAPPSDERVPVNEAVRFGTKWLDLGAHMLRDDAGEELTLTSSEFNLLKAFAENPRRVLSRERLLDLAGARDPDAFDRSIDVRITRIRRKIEPDADQPAFIKTVRGAGYMFLPDGEKR